MRGSCAVNVEDGDDHRFRLRRPADEVGDGVNGIAFDTDKDDVCLSLVFFSRAGRHVKDMLALQVAVQL